MHPAENQFRTKCEKNITGPRSVFTPHVSQLGANDLHVPPPQEEFHLHGCFSSILFKSTLKNFIVCTSFSPLTSALSRVPFSLPSIASRVCFSDSRFFQMLALVHSHRGRATRRRTTASREAWRVICLENFVQATAIPD